MKLSAALSLATLVLLSSNLLAAPRKWSDRTGEFTVTAEFVQFKDNKVYLEKSDGQVISVPIEKLSYSDYDYLRARSDMTSYFRKNPLPTEHTIFQVKFDRGFGFVTFSPNNRFVAGATDYGVFMLDLDKKSHILTRVSSNSISYLTFAKFTPDGKTLVTHSSITNSVTTWQVDSEGGLSGEKSFPLAVSKKILCMAFHPGGQYALSGDERHNLCYWDLNTGELKYSFQNMFKGSVDGCFINPKGTQAVATDGEFAILFDLQLGKPLQKTQLSSTHVYRAALAGDGKRVFAEYSGTVYGYTTVDGQGKLQIKPQGSGAVLKLVPSIGGNYLLVGKFNSVDFWNTASAQHIHNFLTVGGGHIRVMAISPDNRRIAVASGSGEPDLQIFRNPAVPD